jgi:hypothetical protein
VRPLHTLEDCVWIVRTLSLATVKP